jgi:hypothetical protein
MVFVSLSVTVCNRKVCSCVWVGIDRKIDRSVVLFIFLRLSTMLCFSAFDRIIYLFIKRRDAAKKIDEQSWIEVYFTYTILYGICVFRFDHWNFICHCITLRTIEHISIFIISVCNAVKLYAVVTEVRFFVEKRKIVERSTGDLSMTRHYSQIAVKHGRNQTICERIVDAEPAAKIVKD